MSLLAKNCRVVSVAEGKEGADAFTEDEAAADRREKGGDRSALVCRYPAGRL
jgi:hypothetical protein